MAKGKKGKGPNPEFKAALLQFRDKHPDLYPGPEHLIQLDKMEAARRQLNTASWLWFREGDPASIHTITGAAFGVLSDLYFHRFKRRPAPMDESHMPDELRPFAKDLRNAMAATQTFLKHARWDLDGSHTFSVRWSEHYLFNAIKIYSELKGTPGKPVCDQPLMSLFVLRFSLLNPGIFGGNSVVPAYQDAWDIDALKKLTRVEYFRRFQSPFFDRPPDGG